MPRKIHRVVKDSEWSPIHLTDAIVKRQPAPTRPNQLRRDTTEIGFALCVTRNGSKSFVLNYTTRGGRERRYTIGRVSDWSTVAARQEARRLAQLVDQGGDPLAAVEEERAAPTMAELCDRFANEYVTRKRESTQRDYFAIIKRFIRPNFGKHTRAADVQFSDVDSLCRKVTRENGAYIANRVHSVIRRMFKLSIRWGMRTDNPAQGIERNVEYHRRRYLAGDELARLTKALTAHSDQQSANIVRVLLLTGARKGEVLAMRWTDLNLTEGVWSKLPSSTKQKEHHQVPLSAPVRQLLAEIQAEQMSRHPKRPLGEFVFPGIGDSGHQIDIKKSWRVLCRAAGIDNLRIHDLRHSFASQLASGGASLPLIGQLLGHSQPSTTARYSHLFLDSQKTAVEKVGSIIAAATEGAPPAPPIPLKSR
jgi:integrase